MTITANPPATYEYLTVDVPRDQQLLYRDCYAAFGWIEMAAHSASYQTGVIRLDLRRDRRLPNRSVVTELQHRCEDALRQVQLLRRATVVQSTVVALSVGLVGSAALAGSVFTFLAALYIPFVILGVLGLAGWALGYLAYGRVKSNATSKHAPQIDRQLDVVYDTCEQAQRLRDPDSYVSGQS